MSPPRPQVTDEMNRRFVAEQQARDAENSMESLPNRTLRLGHRSPITKGDGPPKLSRFFGLDTETYRGFAKLICLTNPDYSYKQTISIDVGSRITLDDVSYRQMPWPVFDILTSDKAFRGKVLNTVFNLRFDIESILKYLPEEVISDLIHYNQAYTTGYWENDYLIWFVPKKIFEVTRLKPNWEYLKDHKQPYTTPSKFCVFDIAQFFPGMKLEKAGPKYLGMEKISSVDSKRLNLDIQYWKDNFSEIKRYCYEDAHLAASLSKFMSERIWKAFEVSMYRPFSPATISQRIFIKRSGVMHPPIWPKHNQFIYNCFYGGRIECRLRGEIEQASVIDLKSAYIWSMKDLPDTKGYWATNGTFYELDESPYAFVKAEVETDCDSWGPLPFRNQNNYLTYPQGKFTGYWIWPELRFAMDRGLIRKVKILESLYLIPDPHNEKPFSYLMDLYNAKENEPDKVQRMVIKTNGLGIYGKTAQAISGIEEDEEGSISIGSKNYIRVRKPGYLFNPAIAAYVTGLVRVRLLEKALELGDKAIALMTDAVIRKGIAIDSSSSLGGWDTKEEKGRLRLLMSGVYQVKGFGAKTRGYELTEDEDEDEEEVELEKGCSCCCGMAANCFKKGCSCCTHAWDLWSLSGREFKVVKLKPLHLAGCFRRGCVDKVNVFDPYEKVITPKADEKRVWDKVDTFEGLWGNEWEGGVISLT